jgi:hypothetical protein
MRKMSDSDESRKRSISQEQHARAVELVEMIRSPIYSDEENAALTAELKRLIPHPGWDDLLFWHTPELSDEDAVDEALRYRPIAL